ncbi:MAG: LytR/AlgR family response regulator transcription factor [Gemmatimonadales bacterium]
MAAEGAGIRTAIVEDEAVARRTLRRLLEQDPDVELVGEASGTVAPRLILETRPDLVFLDVQMPGMSGLDVLAAVQDRHVPLVVFVTAHDEYAVQAFELRALDYLLKPFTDDRFREALARAKASIRQAETLRVVGRIREVVAGREHQRADLGPLEPAPPSAGYRSRIGVRAEGRTTLLEVGEVDWIEAVGSNVRVYAGRTRAMVRTALAELEASLDPRRFFRIHRSAIVNLERVKHLEHWSHGDYLVVLTDGTELRLSRLRRHALEEVLGTTL